MTTQRRQSVTLLIFTALCVGIFVLLLHIAGGTNLASKYTFEVAVPDAVQLVPGADVREAGVNVGTVRAISNRGDSAVLGLALNRKYAPVYGNATVRVATKTFVGENYIDLNPGDPSAARVPTGGALPISHAETAVQLDQILSVFGPARQLATRRLLAGLGGGLAGQGQQLNRTVGALSGTLSNAAPVAQALTDQSQQLAGLATDLSSVLAALAERGTEIQQFVTAGTGAARTVAARDRALAADLRALPGTIATVAAVGRHLAGVGTNANPVLDQLGNALGDLTPALRTLPHAGAVTLDALRRLQSVTPVATRLVDALRSSTPSIAGAVTPLVTTFDQLRPLVAYLAPYAKDLNVLLSEMNSVGQTSDANGPLAHLLPVFGESTVQNLTASQRQMLNALVSAGAAQSFAPKGVNAYPAPGTALTPQPLTGSYPRLTPDRAR